jgi:hypothetical protein
MGVPAASPPCPLERATAPDGQPSQQPIGSTHGDNHCHRAHDPRSSLLPLVVLSLCGFTSVTTELMPCGLLTRIASDLGAGIAAAGTRTSVYAAAIVVTVLPLTRKLR